MAKFEVTFNTDFNRLLAYMDSRILESSVSASFEDSSYRVYNGVQCVVRVYERYSVFGSNRLSLTLTLVGYENQVFVSVITSGGSQGVFFKFNTIGEEAFLSKVIDILQSYRE